MGNLDQVTIPHVIRLQPSNGWVDLKFRDVWQYRELLYFLTWRDIKVRYKQSLLGAGWAILQPLLTMVIFTFVFGYIAGVPSNGLPYPVFCFAALLPWQYFANAISRSGVSVVNNANLISKVYFPRLIVPLSAAIAPMIDFAIAFVILILLMVWYGITPSAGLIFLPIFMMFAFVTALAVSLWLSALNVRYRDITYLIPFLVQVWMYISPVAYPTDAVPERWRAIYSLNPIAGVVDGFRWALLGTGAPPNTSTLASAVMVLVILVSGLLYFKKTEETFADII